MWIFKPRKQKVSFPGRDIHNHLLPGVDDGFRRAEDSLLAIERLAAVGCKDLVFTPHMNPDVYPDENENHFREVYASFSERIPKELGVKTALASEYMIVKDFEERADDPELLTYEDRSILVEMSYYFRSENLEQAVFNLVSAGKKPILAHPERYLYMSGRLQDFDTLIDMGCRLQMNWMSLTGAYGPASMKILRHLLSHDMYSFVCTDLHSLHQLDTILGIELEPSIAKKVNELIASY